MILKLIAAVARDGGLGKNSELLFSIRRDMQHFKELTTGKTVIMGRGTLDSLPGGRPLPNRRNLVLTRRRDFTRFGAEMFREPSRLIEALGDEEEAWVIGGAEIYRLFLPLCSEMELTQVDQLREADCFFPPFGDEWEMVHSSPWQEENGVRFRFCRYVRQQTSEEV